MMNLRIIALILLCPLLSVGQNMTVGPELGMNIIQVENEKLGKDYQLGLFIGGAFEYEINDWLSLRSGLHYSQTKQASVAYDTSDFQFFGFSIDSIPGIDMSTYSKTYSRQTQSFLQIPLMASFKWHEYNFSLGAYMGFMIGALRKENRVDDTPFLQAIDLASFDTTGMFSAFFPEAHQEIFSETSETDNLRAFDYGLRVSIGYQREEFGVNLTYNFGIPDYRNKSDELKRHQYFQISLRYMLNISKNKAISSLPGSI